MDGWMDGGRTDVGMDGKRAADGQMGGWRMDEWKDVAWMDENNDNIKVWYRLTFQIF